MGFFHLRVACMTAEEDRSAHFQQASLAHFAKHTQRRYDIEERYGGANQGLGGGFVF
jgi:hypothetical protein